MKISYTQKKKLMSLFMLIVFGGSTLAFVFLQAFSPSGTSSDEPIENQIDTTQLRFDYPLTSVEESAYIQAGIVVVKYYYSQDCEECLLGTTITDQLFSDFEGKILLESINTDEYSSLEKAPSIVVKGSTSKTLIIMDYALLRQTTCGLFFSQPESC
jgi:hypothetical protein